MAPRTQPAKFGPIPPDLDLYALVEQTPNFKWVDRISCRAIDEQGMDAFNKTVEAHVIKHGVPLVVDGWQDKLERWTFSARWLQDNVGDKVESARYLNKQENMPLSISHYLNNMGKLCDQWNHYNYKDPKRQRLYLKDIDCPNLWHEKLRETIPGSVFYLNESTGDVGGPGSSEELNPNGIGTRMGKGIARAGDLMSSLPADMRAENLMCYVGHEGTYTPTHREMCASLGQNIMVETSDALDEGGKRAKPGSSIWFMTETHDRQVVSEYWLSALGHDIEVEKHFAHINAWRKAPFTVYIVEQKIGDLILIPPLAPHQVWNRGTRTMKVAWNRITVDTLELALSEALPRARLVCRDEQYKNKSIVLFTLNKYHGLLSKLEERRQSAAQRGDEAGFKSLLGLKIRQLRKDFKRLFTLFNSMMLSESFSLEISAPKVEMIKYDSNVTCSYCRCNIFNRFLTCRHCADEEDTYDVCMECFAMGRSCRCIGKLEWVQQFPWKDLAEKHEIWRAMYIGLDGGPKERSPQPLTLEQRYRRERTLAEICQLELKRRPFKDPKKPEPESDASDDSNDEDITASGAPKKNARRKKKHNDKWLSENLPCHICAYRHPKWKEAVCTNCGIAYCYGSLWRGFDLMPQQILEDRKWQCPRCCLNCTCKQCCKNPKNRPYEPTGTVLGHDTHEYADPRSIESLVDFSISNRHWIQKTGDVENSHGTRRLQRRQSQAIQHKVNAEANEEGSDVDAEGELHDPSSDESRSISSEDDNDIPIDPALTGGKPPEWSDVKKRNKARKQASKALEAMSNLTRLEQDPSAFISAAGLTPFLDDDGELFVPATGVTGVESGSPGANVEGRRFADNSDVERSGRPTGQGKGAKTRKKQGAARNANESAAADEEANGQAPTANERFQAMAEKKRIGEAKKNKQLIAARAAMRGLSKMVVLRLPTSYLERFPAGTTSVQITSQVPVEDAANGPGTIVESNVPEHQSPRQASARAAQISKKRVRDEDLDEDFNVSSRQRRSQKQIREAKDSARRDAIEQVGISDDDMIVDRSNESSSDDDRPSVPTGSQRRSLPGYLAQRESLDPDAPLPKELRNEPRPSRRPTKSTAMPERPRNRMSAKESEQNMLDANRAAKLRAAQGIETEREEEDGGRRGEEEAEQEEVEKERDHRGNKQAGALLTRESMRRSIFASRGRGGKIKIKSSRK